LGLRGLEGRVGDGLSARVRLGTGLAGAQGRRNLDVGFSMYCHRDGKGSGGALLCAERVAGRLCQEGPSYLQLADLVLDTALVLAPHDIPQIGAYGLRLLYRRLYGVLQGLCHHRPVAATPEEPLQPHGEVLPGLRSHTEGKPPQSLTRTGSGWHVNTLSLV
jgi:hypothetical protein